KARLATQNIHRFLGEILVERQIISAGQVTELLAQQGKHPIECRGCGYRFNAPHDQGYACPECGAALGQLEEITPVSPLPLTVREEVGSGPAGTVLRAFDETLRQEIALKILKPDRIPGDLARRAAEIRHPNVARTL